MLITNIGTLVTNDPELGTLTNAAILFDAGKVAWVGHTPPEAVAKLSQALNAALAQPEVKEKFSGAGLETVSSTPAEFAAFIRSEIAKWGKVAKEANIKVDP